MKIRTLVLLAIIATFATGYLFTSCSTDKKTAPAKSEATARTPEEELAGFKIADGFIIELVASEKDGIINPIDITFDDAGRLWTQTAAMYPLDPIADIKWNDLLELMNDQEKQKNHPNFKRIHDLYLGKTKGTDKILVLSGFYNYNNPPVKTQVWADSLTIPMSILPYKNGAYVAQGSELFFLDDANKDGKADERVPMFTGFGFTDTHTMAHSLIRGPGGWLYFSHGALNKGEVKSYVNDLKLKMEYSKIARFTGDAKKMELVTAGLNNIWGFQLRNNGQWYITEANDLGFSVVPLDPGSAFRGIGNDRFRSYQPWMPELFKFRVGGTGISGLAFADDATNSFPDEWKNVAFLANPITSTINAVKVMRNPDGTVSGEHLSDFLVSGDKFFRPVNMEFGPDGCLYIADWYNKIISHNEVPTTHPDRDKTHGRIWRIRHKNQKPHKVTDFTSLPASQLVENLKSPSLWAKRAAWHQITDRPSAETSNLVPALIALAADKSQDEATRIHALWSLEGLKHYDAELTKKLLADNGNSNVRREAIRSLASFSLNTADVATATADLIEDANPMIRSQVLRTLTDLGKADAQIISILVKACKPELPGNEMGGSYERRFERYLALKALEQYQPELIAYINSGVAIPAENLLWVANALPKDIRDKKFLEAWPAAQLNEFHEAGFIMTANMIDNPRIYSAIKPIIDNPAHAKKYLRFALANQQQIRASKLPDLVAPAAIGLLKSDSAADIQLALDAIGRLKIKAPREAVLSQINEKAANNTVQLAIKVLENDPKQNIDVFRKVFKNEKFAFEARLAALNSLAKADQKEALQLSQVWLPSLKDEQKQTFAFSLSGSEHGSNLLKNLYAQKLLGSEAFSLSAAERVRDANPKDERGLTIYQNVEKRLEDERKELDSKLKKYMAIAEKNEGDAVKGKALFQTCLMCHKVGDKGQDIAPALDGSAARENEALLTALLDPDAAVERGYELYRVTKNDNTVIEGYLYQRDGNGITIANMGGTKTFIAVADIKSSGFLGGRSFMPKGIISHYSDEDVANLVAYIKTLK